MDDSQLVGLIGQIKSDTGFLRAKFESIENRVSIHENRLRTIESENRDRDKARWKWEGARTALYSLMLVLISIFT